MKKAFSKSLSWLLSVVIIFGMLVVSNVSLTASAYSYNASAAVDYARQYWNNYNSAYTNYNSMGGDCANFVSQCLYAGGLEQDDRWYNGSAAWISCSSQIAYFRDMGFTGIDYAQASDIQIGNPIYYYNGNSMSHTAICVGYSSDGTPLVAAHNKNHWEYEWTLGGANWWGGSTRRVTILMPDNIEPPKNLSISVDKTQYVVGESVTFDFTSENATTLAIPIDVNGERKHWLDVAGKSSYTTSFDEPGFYYFALYGKNSVGDSMTDFYLFTVYDSKPTDLSISSDKTQYAVGENVTFNFTSKNATQLGIPIDVNGKRKHWIDVAGKSSYTTSFDEPGFYYFGLYGKNELGDTMTDFYLFTVYDSKPIDLSISSDKTQYAVGENVTFNFTSKNATTLAIPIDVNGKRKHWLDVAGQSSYTTSFDEPGYYYFALYGKNDFGDTMTDFYLFTVYDSKPSNPKISTDKKVYHTGEKVTFDFSVKNATEIYIPIDVNGKRKYWNDVTGKTSYITSFDESGTYGYFLHGVNNYGTTDIDYHSFCVIDDDNNGHDYKTIIVPPTTSEQGYTLHTCSVCGDSYKDNYTNILLSNNSTLSAETIKLGETITATAKATGGTGEYLYQVVYKQTTQSKWTTAQSYKANSIVTFKPANAVAYDVCVKVKDSNNTEVKKFFTVKVTSDELKNVSTISAQTINLGSTVTVNAKATGSTGFYTYAVYYKQKTQTKWTTKQDFKSNNTIAVKPAKDTTYDICVKVKDDKGTIVKKYFTVNVTNFVNTSTLSATEIKLGNTVKVSCSATGSTGYYQYAVYYKKTSDTKWTTKQNYSSNNIVTIKPAKATTYDVCVKVKDNQDNVIKKYFTVTVK